MNQLFHHMYSKFIKHVVVPIWAVKDRSKYLKHLVYLNKSQFFPLNELEAIRLKKLKNLLYHTSQNVGYYKQLFKKSCFDVNDITKIEDLRELPVLTKDDIRINLNQMISSQHSVTDLQFKKTSGSTGVSLNFYCDHESSQWKRAIAVRHDQWTGWDLGDRVAALWGNPEYLHSWKLWLRNAFLDRYIYLDTLKMDEEVMLNYYRKLLKFPPKIYFGHAHSLYLYAAFLKEKNLQPRPASGIISTAMVLHKHERKLIEDVLGARVFNRYGCEEVSLIASECEAHNGLHMNLDNLVIEVLDDRGNPVKPGEPGMIILTDLSNYGMPFIRYKVGDVGILSSKICSCGRTLPLFEKIEGRTADYIRTPEGKLISGISLTENFAMLLPELKQLQIVQEKIDFLVFKVVLSDGSLDLESKIRKLVKERFGKNMHFAIKNVKNIPQEKSGKYRFCISKITSSLN